MTELPWTAVWDEAPKPFVHPVVAPGGRVLSALTTPRHPWHRGLWFAIKYVDGVNFWEEPDGALFGVQRLVAPNTLQWTTTDDVVVLEEVRRLTHVPMPEGAYAIDWESTISAPASAVLDRTPYTTWGGYGGLAFRGAADWPDTTIALADGSTHRRPEGIRARWADLSGVDSGLTFLDHPANPSHPVPWYGATRSSVYGDGWANFLNAAFLFEGPLTIPAGGSLSFRYRVVVHGGAASGWTASRSDDAWNHWVLE